MKLNIYVPQRQRKNLRLVLGDGRNEEILNGYYCTQNCINCGLKNFDTDRGLRINDLERKGCQNCNLKTPVFSLKIELNEIEKLLVI